MFCIDDDGYHLTFGEWYSIINHEQGWVTVVNDVGVIADYPEAAFSKDF